MKRFLLLAIVSISFLGAQAQDDRPIRIGFSALPASSWSVPDAEWLEAENGKFGFSYGLIADFTIGDNSNYAFSTGLLINSHGGTIRNERYHDGSMNPDQAIGGLRPTFATASEKYSLQYLDIPLLLKLKTNEIGYLTYFGEFGLDMSFNISARRDVEALFPNGDKITIEDQNAQNDVNLLRMALQVGGGAEFNISGDTYLMAAIIWNNGLTDVFETESIKANGDGTPVIVDGNATFERGDDYNAATNYLGLQLGIFF